YCVSREEEEGVRIRSYIVYSIRKQKEKKVGAYCIRPQRSI
ncbi:unnamed protein product, partial [marine sediment metagenome]